MANRHRDVLKVIHRPNIHGNLSMQVAENIQQDEVFPGIAKYELRLEVPSSFSASVAARS